MQLTSQATNENKTSAFQTLEIKGMNAVILDMDGVITRTADVHKKAWKKMFEEYLQHTDAETNEFTDNDYIRYVDGLPRYEGVKNFLEAVDISIPYGSSKDEAGKNTICGLGNKKNKLFLELIHRNGVLTYPEAIKQIKKWRNRDLSIAVVSSSKNCVEILKLAGILELFDCCIDGNSLQNTTLKGKPEPDMFLKAAEELNAKPDRCVVFEDATSGVEAGRQGNFAFVVGVARTNNKKKLYDNGADLVIESFQEITIYNNLVIKPHFTQYIPSFFKHKNDFKKTLRGRKPLLFLDYDGTLSPIVNHPEDARLPDQTKNLLKRYAKKNVIGIISGRDLDNLKEKVQIEPLIYAGSHGFRISGPNGLNLELNEAKDYHSKLDKAGDILSSTFGNTVPGLKIERKRYAIAIHYRNVDENRLQELFLKIHDLTEKMKGLKKDKGKKIIEIKPDLDWHKGKAIEWIMKKLKMNNTDQYMPVYLGDDTTDEDAFKTITDTGVGILVGSHTQPSAAKYSLKNTNEVNIFLETLEKEY